MSHFVGSVRLGEINIAEVFFNHQWVPICGHWFWDNDEGANLFCHELGFETGKIRKTKLTLLSDGLSVGRCVKGDTWLQCSHRNCNQLKVGGQCNNGGSCKKGQNAAVSIACFDKGMYVVIVIFI